MLKKLFFVICTLLLAVSCALPPQAQALVEPYRDNDLAQAYRFVPLEEGRLYSSMEPRGDYLDWLLEEKGVKTFISLRGGMREESKQRIERAGGKVIVYAWSAYSLPPQDEIDEVLGHLDHTPHAAPALIFCKAGVDRTGFARALWRISHQGWSTRDALKNFVP
jgi:protein tyrosine/serine phosphatase